MMEYRVGRGEGWRERMKCSFILLGETERPGRGWGEWGGIFVYVLFSVLTAPREGLVHSTCCRRWDWSF